MKKIVLPMFVFLLFLASCSTTNKHSIAKLFQSDTSTPVPTMTASSTATLDATSTVTPSPLPSSTITPSATPMGGKPLRVAYLGFDCMEVDSSKCIIIADFFTGEGKYKIPLGDKTQFIHLSWSPNGRYLLYTNWWENYMDIMIYDMQTTQSEKVESQILFKPTTESGMVTYPYPNGLGKTSWSPNNRYLAYKSFFNGENNSVNIFSLDDFSNRKVFGYMYSYYWLDDGESLVEIKTGTVYNAKENKTTIIENAYFMNIDSKTETYLISSHGDEPYMPDKISLFPYVRDLQTLQENGTKIIYDKEILFAEAYKDKKRDPSISISQLFIQDNEVIYSGVLTLHDPWEYHPYIKFGTMDQLPFKIELDEHENEDDSYWEDIVMISPDHQLYFTSDLFWDKDQTTYTILNCYDLHSHELLHTYDMHDPANNPHDVSYTNHSNLAFYWEEE